MITRYLVRSGIVLLLLAFSSSIARAQLNATLQGEASQTIGTKKAYDYNITITNNGLAPVDFYVLRTLNGLPSEEWASTICLEDLCLAPQVDQSHTETIDPGSDFHVKFTVHTGPTDGEVGNFHVELHTAGLGGSVFEAYDLSVESSEALSVPDLLTTPVTPYPNPATSYVMLPTEPTNSDIVRVFTADGRNVNVSARRVDGAYRLSTETMQPGVYLFDISSTERREQGSFVVR